LVKKTEPKILEKGMSRAALVSLHHNVLHVFRLKASQINPIINPIPAAENAAPQPILFLKNGSGKIAHQCTIFNTHIKEIIGIIF
jgi:hypothetical protein